MPFGQLVLRRGLSQAGDDVGDEFYYWEIFVRECVVKGGIFDPRALPELQLEPERFPIYAGRRLDQLTLAGGHLPPGDDQPRTERGEIFEKHEICQAAWGDTAEVVVQLEVGRGVDGRHLNSFDWWHARFHRQPEETVEVALSRDRVGRRTVGGKEDTTGFDLLLRDDAE